jgi:hypothetical protein
MTVRLATALAVLALLVIAVVARFPRPAREPAAPPPPLPTASTLLDELEALERAADELANDLDRALPPADAARLRSARAVDGPLGWLRDGLASAPAALPPDLHARWTALARKAAAHEAALVRIGTP